MAFALAIEASHRRPFFSLALHLLLSAVLAAMALLLAVVAGKRLLGLGAVAPPMVVAVAVPALHWRLRLWAVCESMA